MDLIFQKKIVKQDMFELTYGEMTFFTLVDILKIINPKSDFIFYDLGSGTGKVIIAAALLYPFKQLIGIEILSSLYQCSLSIKEQLKNKSDFLVFNNQNNIHFVHADFLKYDFSDADCIYVNATGFFGEPKETLIKKLSQIKQVALLLSIQNLYQNQTSN